MDNSDFDFWKLAYNMGLATKDTLSKAVNCKTNPYGDITPDQYKLICGEDFNIKEV